MIKSELRNQLTNYRDITLKIIDSLNKESFDDLEGLFNNREKIIQFINTLEYLGEDFVPIANELKLQELEELIGKIINEKKTSIKSEIYKLSAGKDASRGYNKNIYGRSGIFSKKI